MLFSYIFLERATRELFTLNSSTYCELCVWWGPLPEAFMRAAFFFFVAGFYRAVLAPWVTRLFAAVLLYKLEGAHRSELE